MAIEANISNTLQAINQDKYVEVIVEAEVVNVLQAMSQDANAEIIVEANIENTLQAINQDKYVHMRRPQRFVMFSNFWQFGKIP